MSGRDNFDYLSPLDTRYYGEDDWVYEALHPYLSEAACVDYQIIVERAIVATLEEHDVAPRGISRRLADAAKKVTPKAVYEEEHKTHHNIRALVNCLKRDLPEQQQAYVHLFATSADIQDTARSLALRDFTRVVLLPQMKSLVLQLIEVAEKHAGTVQIGRTHGRYAEPITIGYWLANFIARLTQRAEKIAVAASDLRGKFSGAVGAHSALALRWQRDPAAIEERVLARLRLKPGHGAVSTQVIQPEYLVDYGHALVSTFGVMANIADDYRQLMRSEIEEVVEDLAAYQVGSSTMPHKINPKNFENVKSLWKAFMPRMTTIYMDQISEHQRDLTNSASMRFFNELAAATFYSAYRLRDAVEKTKVNSPTLKRNLKDSSRWIVAEPLYIAYALAGHPDPYNAVRDLVIESRKQDKDLPLLLQEDEDAKVMWKRIPKKLQEIIRHPEQYVGDAESRTILVCEEARASLDHLIGRSATDLAGPSEDDLFASS